MTTAAGPAGPRIQMVISDFGGVLTTPLVAAFQNVQDQIGVSPAVFRDALWGMTDAAGDNPFFALERGQIPETEFNRCFADALEPLLGHRPDIGDFGQALFSHLAPNPEMIDLIRQVREDGFRAALLTNNVREWESTWRAMLPVDELFETVVDSAFVGMRKPEPAIYHLTLERIGLPPEACIFIDDMEANCAAAAEIGIHAVHFRDTAQAQTEVRSLLGEHGHIA